MKAFFVGVLMLGLVAALAMLFMGTTVARYNLITVQGPFWYFAGGLIFLIGGGILVANDVSPGAFFAGFGSLLLIIGGAKATWPNTSAASAHAQAAVDADGATTLNTAFGARQIPCDRTTRPRPDFFDRVTGKPLIWVAWDKDSSRFECFNRPGFHPLTREALVAVDAKLAREIMDQSPPDSKLHELASEPMTSPTPLPELGTADVTEEDIRSPNKKIVPQR